MNFYTKALLLPLFLFSGVTYAGTGSGVVTRIYAHAGDVVIFAAGTHNGKPACSGEEWAFSVANPTGRAMLALLLSAQAQGKAVSVQGSDQCTAWSDREAPVYIYVN